MDGQPVILGRTIGDVEHRAAAVGAMHPLDQAAEGERALEGADRGEDGPARPLHDEPRADRDRGLEAVEDRDAVAPVREQRRRRQTADPGARNPDVQLAHRPAPQSSRPSQLSCTAG